MRFNPFAVAGAVLGLASSAIAAPAPQNGFPYDCSAGTTVYITRHSIDTVALGLEQPTSTAIATLYSTITVTATTSPEASTVYITLNPIDTVDIGTLTATHAFTSTRTSTETALATEPALLTFAENVGASSASAYDVSSSTAFLDITSEPAATVVSPGEGENATPLASTSTLYNTVLITEAITVFTTLASGTASSISAGFSSDTAAASATGASFTGLSPEGWNTTGALSGVPSSIAASSSADAIAGSYIVSTDLNEPSLYQPWAPPASIPSSFAARSGFGGGYGMISQVSPATATQPAFISATVYGSVVSWPNPYYTGTRDSSLAASTAASTSSASSIAASSSVEAAGSSTTSSVVYYTPSGTASSISTASSTGLAGSGTLSPFTVYYTPPSPSGTSSSASNTTTPSSDSVDSSAPVVSTTADACASACMSAYNTCLGQTDPNRAVCTGEYVSCLGYSPYNNGSFVTPTACSTTASATSTSSSVSLSTASYSTGSIVSSSTPPLSSAAPVANSTSLTGSSGSSQTSLSPASSLYDTSSSGSPSSLLGGITGGYRLGQPTASNSGSSVTTVSPESGSTVLQISTVPTSVFFPLNSSSLTTTSLSVSSSSAYDAITTSYSSLKSSSVDQSTGASSSANSATMTSASSSGHVDLPPADFTSASGSASPTPTSCGEHGSFTLNWDDLPTLVANNLSDPNTIQPPPIFNPYHQFWFSTGFVDVPLPKDPYNPSSPPHLLEFITNFDAGTDTEAGPDAIDLGTTGEVGNGPYMSLEYMAFNATGASMGCDSTGPDCSFQFTGVRYDPSIQASLEVTSQMIDVPACPALNNCDLVPITLDETFVSLSALRINVTVDGIPKIWFMDDLELGWFNNTCAAGLARQSHR